MNNVALFTVFYPGVEKYLDDFMKSVESQTFKQFDLIVLNDSCACQDVLQKYKKINIIELSYSSTIAGNREYGINYIRQCGYEVLVLCDADDYFHPKRVAESVNALKYGDIVVNDLHIVNSRKESLCRSYFNERQLEKINLDRDFIKEKNVFGFSNTAFKLAVLHEEIVFPKDIKIVDWYFFTKLIFQGCEVHYIPMSLTYYRQHAANLLGLGSTTLDKFRQMIDQKIRHCQECSSLDSFFVQEERRLKSLKMLPDDLLANIVKNNETKNPHSLWWENVKG